MNKFLKSMSVYISFCVMAYRNHNFTIFYDDLVHKFNKIVGTCRTDFADQFGKLIIRSKRIGYNVNVMRQLHA